VQNGVGIAPERLHAPQDVRRHERAVLDPEPRVGFGWARIALSYEVRTISIATSPLAWTPTCHPFGVGLQHAAVELLLRHDQDPDVLRAAPRRVWTTAAVRPAIAPSV
jgi:hypothetical protein